MPLTSLWCVFWICVSVGGIGVTLSLVIYHKKLLIAVVVKSKSLSKKTVRVGDLG